MPIFIGSCSCPKSLQLFGNMPWGFGFWLRLKSNILCAFCFSPAWWLWRSVYTRSHLELGRKSLQRQWYFVLRRGRVGRCQACERQKAKTLHHEIQTSNPLTRNGSGFCVAGPLIKINAVIPGRFARPFPGNTAIFYNATINSIYK